MPGKTKFTVEAVNFRQCEEHLSRSSVGALSFFNINELILISSDLRNGRIKRMRSIAACVQAAINITDNIIHINVGQRTTAAQVREFVKASDLMIRSLDKLRILAFPPPALPIEWKKAVNSWINMEKEAQSKASGRPLNAVYNSIPMILGLYEFSYDKNASSSNDGPTVDFVRRYIEMFRNAITQTEFSNYTEKRHIIEMWNISEDGISTRVCRAVRNGRRKGEQRVFQTRISPYLP